MADIYSGSSPFDQSVEKATPDRDGESDWAAVMDICDKASQASDGCKDCLKSIMKRLQHSSVNVQTRAVTLLDSCILNCGASFHKQVATPDFVKASRAFLNKAQSSVADKFKENLKKWAESEFKSDSKLSVIPTFYQALRSEGAYFGMGTKSTVSPTTSQSAAKSTASVPGDDDLEKAIALSLKESQSKSQTTSLYPTMATLSSSTSSVPTQSPSYDASSKAIATSGLQVKALYDFEAVEENELTFKSGEMIKVLDDSDANWWKGSTWRGEGLFPVNFVTTDLSVDSAVDASQMKKSVQFNEEVQVEQFDPVNVRIDEAVIDQALEQIQNADPSGLTEDPAEMTNLEGECKAMGPLIDQELEKIDAKHNELMSLNNKLTEAFQRYSQLMEAPPSTQYTSTMGGYMPASYASPAQPPVDPATGYMYGDAQQQASYYGAGQQYIPPQQAQQLPEQPAFSNTVNMPALHQMPAAMPDMNYAAMAGGPTANTFQQNMYNTSPAGYQHS